MNSKRFPGKVLHKVRGKPLLQYLLESLSRCSLLDQVVVATSVEPSDDSVAMFCQEYGIACYRGSQLDVAGRFVETLDTYGFDAFVRLSGDSPLLDHRLVDKAADIFRSDRFDLVTNILRRTFPKGQSVEVLDSAAFKAAYLRMRKANEREHITPYFYTHEEEFKIHNFESGHDYGHFQLSVDTPEDMRRFEMIVTGMDNPHWEYTFEEILELSSSL